MKEELLAKIQSYKDQMAGAQNAIAQHQQAIANAAAVIEQAKGGIATLVWTIEELEKAEAKALEDKKVADEAAEKLNAYKRVPADKSYYDGKQAGQVTGTLGPASDTVTARE